MNWTPWLPFLRWCPRVNRQTLRFDAIAGLTGGIILVPQGVAFATVAGMPPEPASTSTFQP
jgi:SulP family sulfate permease